MAAMPGGRVAAPPVLRVSSDVASADAEMRGGERGVSESELSAMRTLVRNFVVPLGARPSASRPAQKRLGAV